MFASSFINVWAARFVHYFPYSTYSNALNYLWNFLVEWGLLNITLQYGFDIKEKKNLIKVQGVEGARLSEQLWCKMVAICTFVWTLALQPWPVSEAEQISSF